MPPNPRGPRDRGRSESPHSTGIAVTTPDQSFAHCRWRRLRNLGTQIETSQITIALELVNAFIFRGTKVPFLKDLYRHDEVLRLVR
jgi:hypothetical protein